MRRVAAALATAVVACACSPVAPYQRGYLARPDMAMEPVDAGTAKALERTYSAKEAARGGASIGGGGCGCN
ncbi:MAG TPA: DUF4266 domain-containing protein [Usitatibacter sp.]|nr:DUF4266 domain-containing protein [Usitatibacter sp.]